jgi:Zn-dependent peptidase ImmA (M78 family)
VAKRSAIEEHVLRILSEHNITKPPVPVDRLIRLQGIKIVMKSMENNVSGFILQEDGKSLIAINSFHPPVRQRFTLAHELGHYLLKHKPQGMIVDNNDFPLLWRDDEASKGTNNQEREANLFASLLLMPRAFLENDLQNLRNVDTHNDTFTKNLAKKYGVSPQAMLLRISGLSEFRSQ